MKISYELLSVINRWKLDYLFNMLLKLTTEKTTQPLLLLLVPDIYRYNGITMIHFAYSCDQHHGLCIYQNKIGDLTNAVKGFNSYFLIHNECFLQISYPMNENFQKYCLEKCDWQTGRRTDRWNPCIFFHVHEDSCNADFTFFSSFWWTERHGVFIKLLRAARLYTCYP